LPGLVADMAPQQLPRREVHLAVADDLDAAEGRADVSGLEAAVVPPDEGHAGVCVAVACKLLHLSAQLRGKPLFALLLD
jgi:hypothetical protein